MRAPKPRSNIKGITLSRAELRSLIESEPHNQLSKNLCLQMADFDYSLPSFKVAKKIIDNSKMKEFVGPFDAKTRGERFDCHDFSLLLKAGKA